MKANPVVWFEIYVQDMQRAQAFYESVFQCRLRPMQAPGGVPPGTQMMAFPGDDMGSHGATGMLVRMAGVPSGGGGSLVYFSCADCAVEQARAQAAGGRIDKPRFSIDPYGFIALVADTEGNCIGLHSMRRACAVPGGHAAAVAHPDPARQRQQVVAVTGITENRHG